VTGSADVTYTSAPPLSIEIECSGETEDGGVIAAGTISESGDPGTPPGQRAAVIITDGNPDRIQIEAAPGPADSCSELVENTLEGPTDSEPRLVVEGDIETK
jgi:hypothetical protein